MNISQRNEDTPAALKLHGVLLRALEKFDGRIVVNRDRTITAFKYEDAFPTQAEMDQVVGGRAVSSKFVNLSEDVWLIVRFGEARLADVNVLVSSVYCGWVYGDVIIMNKKFYREGV